MIFRFSSRCGVDVGALVVGQEELDGRSVNVRNRDDVGTKAKTQMVPLDEIVEKLITLKKTKSLDNKLV